MSSSYSGSSRDGTPGSNGSFSHGASNLEMENASFNNIQGNYNDRRSSKTVNDHSVKNSTVYYQNGANGPIYNGDITGGVNIRSGEPAAHTKLSESGRSKTSPAQLPSQKTKREELEELEEEEVIAPKMPAPEALMSSTPQLRHVISQPTNVNRGEEEVIAPEALMSPTSRLRHVIIVADSAKKDLVSKTDSIAEILEGRGIRRDEWIAQVGFDQEAFSLDDRNLEYQEEIVITILDPSARAKAIKMDELHQCLPSYIISVRLPDGEVLKTRPSTLPSQVDEQRERRRGENFENAALGKIVDNVRSRDLSVLPATQPDDACIEVRTFDKLRQNDIEVEVATHSAFDIKKTGNESSIEFYDISFVGPQLPNNPYHIQYGHVRVSGDSIRSHRAIQYPAEQPGHGDEIKVTKARKTFSNIVEKVMAKVSAKSGPEFGVGYDTARGRENQEGEEWTKKVTSIHHEAVSGARKLKFNTSALRRTIFRPPRKSDDSAAVAHFSLGRLVDETQDELVKVKLASLWALPSDHYQIPRKINLLKGTRKDKKGKGRDTGSLPMFTNFVHLVEVVFPSNFSGTIADHDSHSSHVVDFTMPAQ